MTRTLVQIDANIIRVSREYAERKVAYYATQEGAGSPSGARSGIWGVETNPVRQAEAKVGEYAVALYYGLDPRTAVNRSPSKADSGGDMTLPFGVVADVKTSPAGKLYVIWSNAVNDLYWKKSFDVLISVSISEDMTQCWIEGCMTKQEFFDLKSVADGVCDQGRLTPGTWFVRKSAMRDIDTIKQGFVGHEPSGAFVHYCQCGKLGPFGEGVSLLKGQLGKWYCGAHRP